MEMYFSLFWRLASLGPDKDPFLLLTWMMSSCCVMSSLTTDPRNGKRRLLTIAVKVLIPFAMALLSQSFHPVRILPSNTILLKSRISSSEFAKHFEIHNRREDE